MDLKLRTRTVGGATVIHVTGEVELQNAAQLRAELLRLVESTQPRVVVDLSDVSFIDSTGVGVLVHGYKRVHERQGRFAVVCPHPRVRRVFEITGLLRSMPLFQTQQEATESVVALAKPAQLVEAEAGTGGVAHG